MIRSRPLLTAGLVIVLGWLWSLPGTAAPAFRQPAYITNAYFSDQVAEDDEGGVRPLSMVKVLHNQPSGLLGYLILDLLLIKPGVHAFRVEIISQQGDKVGEMAYPAVPTFKAGTLPLYTAAMPISGHFSPGLWFFKVFDRINNGTWYALDTFSIMVLDPRAGTGAAQ
ncbi:MAG: hypothetical protein H7838_12690 [Magnetococcus sp. DMHC-8]